MKSIQAILLVLFTMIAGTVHLGAQGTAFTYQGRLNDSNSPANGNYDFTFSLWTNSSGLAQVGTTLTNTATGVTNGVFKVVLNFGANFPGADRYLEISVRTNGGGSFTSLSPRQKITATPYAITSGNVTGTVPATQLGAGTAAIDISGNAAGFTGNLAGDVTGSQASTTVALVSGLSAAGVASGANLANSATSGNSANAIVRRDASGNFSAASVNLSGNLFLPSTTATLGIIKSGSSNILHAFGTQNLFVGVGAGNLTLSQFGNTGVGFTALSHLVNGYQNTAVGTSALTSNSTGLANSAVGYQALLSNTNGGYNTAVGYSALNANRDGTENTAIGANALLFNTSGQLNTAIGVDTLFSNTVGELNTAVGEEAMFYNTTGSYNTAIGRVALYSNATGLYNVAAGIGAMYNNLTGSNNTVSGASALLANTSGSSNVAYGSEALGANTIGNFNTAIGTQALGFTGAGGNNVALGYRAGFNISTGSSNIDIGNMGMFGDTNIIRIGSNQASTFIAGISGAAVTGSTVVVNGSGQLGVAVSSARFKEDIQSMDDASEVLLSLRPVTFRYKPDIDPGGTPQFGLIAEEVDKVAPDLVVRDAEARILTVRYEAVNAMLLNEFLKQHRKVEEQNTAIVRLQEKADRVESLERQLTELQAAVRALAEQN